MIQIDAENYTNEFSILESDLAFCRRRHHWDDSKTGEIDVFGPFWSVGIFRYEHSAELSFCVDEQRIPILPNSVVYLPPFSIFESRIAPQLLQWEGYFSFSEVPEGLPSEPKLFLLNEPLPERDEIKNKSQLWSLIPSDETRGICVSRKTRVNSLALRIKSYLDKNHSEPILLEEMSRNFNSPLAYLDRVFKIAHGISPKVYLKKLRILTSSFWMILNPTSITELTYQMGYNTPDNFSRQFKDVIKAKPSAYLRNHGGVDQFKDI